MIDRDLSQLTASIPDLAAHYSSASLTLLSVDPPTSNMTTRSGKQYNVKTGKCGVTMCGREDYLTPSGICRKCNHYEPCSPMYSHEDSDDEDMAVLCMFCMLPIGESNPAAPGYQFTCCTCANATTFNPVVANITISMEEEDMNLTTCDPATFELEWNRREQACYCSSVAQHAMSDC